MKKIYSLVLSTCVVFSTLFVQAQSPAGINYQAVARDASGNLITNKSLTVKAVILSGSSGSNVEYTETHTITTNDYGHFNIIIGQGSTTNNFGAIDWSNKKHHLKIEIDQGSGFVSMGTVEFQSVPYALSAKNVENIPTLKLNDLDDVNTAGGTNGQFLQWDGTTWKPATVTSGGSLTAGSGININGTVIEATSSTPMWNANKLYGFNVLNSTPSSGEVLKWNGSAWAPGVDNSASYTAGNGLSISGTTISANTGTALWNANQLQGRGIAATAPTSGQLLGWNGTSWTPTTVSSPWNTIGSTYIYTHKQVGIGVDSATTRFDIFDTISGTGFAQYASSQFIIEASNNNQSTSNAHWININGRGGYQNVGIRSRVVGSSTAAYLGSGATGGLFIADGTTGQNNFGIRADAGEDATARNYAVYAHSRGNGTFNMGVFALADKPHNSTTKTNYGIFAWADSANTNYAGYFSGNVTYTGTLAAASDMRLKQNIQPLEGALSRIQNVQIATYEYKTDGMASGMNLAKGKQIGFLAQDLEKSFPELVLNQVHAKGVEAKDEEVESVSYKAVNYIGMIPVLTKAIQEQQEYIKQLELRIAALESQNK